MSADAPPRSADIRATRVAQPRQVPAPLWNGVRIETADLLKAALPAHRALAACSQALARTPLDATALDAFALLDAIGAVQLDGLPLDPREALESAPSRLDETLRRQHDAVRQAARGGHVVGGDCALGLAAAIAGRAVALRRQPLASGEVGQHVVQHPGRGGSADAGPRVEKASRCVLPLPSGVERLQSRLNHWQGFVQRDSGDLDALLMSGTALAEWLAIRPFASGNVRVGQALVQLLLVEEALLPIPVLPLSLYMSRHSDACWRALHASRAASHPEPWLRFFLGAIEHAALDMLARLESWEDVLAVLPITLGELLPKTPSRELVQVCARPSLGMADVIGTGLSRRQTAAAWLVRLIEGGVLRERRAGKEKRFVNDAVVMLLTG